MTRVLLVAVVALVLAVGALFLTSTPRGLGRAMADQMPTPGPSPSPVWLGHLVEGSNIQADVTVHVAVPSVKAVVHKPPPVEQAIRVTGTSTVAAARRFALAQIGPAQYRCLDRLWMHESGWNPREFNPSSGAYGIPQAVPGSKMARAGRDWRTNPLTQVRWGLSYIRARYGSACSALAHWSSHNWY